MGVIVGYYLRFVNVNFVREMYSSPAEVKAVGILFDDYEQNKGISINRILGVQNIKDKESGVATSIYEIKHNVHNKDTSNLDIYIATVDINNNKVEDIIGFKDLINEDIEYTRDEVAKAIGLVRAVYENNHVAFYNIFKIERDSSNFSLFYYIYDKTKGFMDKHVAVIDITEGVVKSIERIVSVDNKLGIESSALNQLSSFSEFKK
jgi:ACT domain-containing protein